MILEPTVFIVDDEPVIRDSLQVLLSTEGIKSEAYASGQEFLDRCDLTKPGCLLLDVRMPGIDGLELQQELIKRSIKIPTIVLTAHADVPVAVSAMQAGAVDLIEKPFDGESLLAQVRVVLRELVEEYQLQLERSAINELVQSLTPREREVLDLIVEGHPTKGISQILGSSFNTVRNQRAAILRKMRADSVVDVVRMVTSLRSG